MEEKQNMLTPCAFSGIGVKHDILMCSFGHSPKVAWLYGFLGRGTEEGGERFKPGERESVEDQRERDAFYSGRYRETGEPSHCRPFITEPSIHFFSSPGHAPC